MLTLSPEEARTRILGQLPLFDTVGDFQVAGDLDLAGETGLIKLPAQLRQAWSINLTGCTSLTSLPDNLQLHRLNVNDCIALQSLPAGLTAHSIQAQRSGLVHLPDDLQVNYKLDLTDCKSLKSLQDNLHTGSLIVRGCSKLEKLPEGLSFYFLDASNCVQLQTWGATGHVEIGKISVSGCSRLSSLPEWMDKIATLNIQGCINLHHLPDHLIVTTTIELADSGLVALPESCAATELHWRDVIVDQKIVFHPEQITAQAIMAETNIELRRVMLERMGYESFFKQANAVELYQDVDPGGIRRLLRVEFKESNRRQMDEPVVCLSVICPSTARSYIIRVPPTMQSCHQAAAWIAGFDNPDHYHPVRET